MKKKFEDLTKNDRLVIAGMATAGMEPKAIAETTGATIGAIRQTIEESQRIVNKTLGEEVAPAVTSAKITKAIEAADEQIDAIQKKVEAEKAAKRKRAKSPSAWKRGERMEVARQLYKKYLDRGEDVFKAVLKEVTGLSTGQCTQYLTHLKETEK